MVAKHKFGEVANEIIKERFLKDNVAIQVSDTEAKLFRDGFIYLTRDELEYVIANRIKNNIKEE